MTGALVQTRLQARGLGAGTPWMIERARRDATPITATVVHVRRARPTASPRRRRTASACRSRRDRSATPTATTFAARPSRISWAEGGERSRPRHRRRRSSSTRPAASARGSSSFTPGRADDHRHRDQLGAGRVDDDDRARRLRWTVDDGASAGSSTRQHELHDARGRIGIAGSSGSEVLDGSYQITGAAVRRPRRRRRGQARRTSCSTAPALRAAVVRGRARHARWTTGSTCEWAATASATSSATAWRERRRRHVGTATTSRSARRPATARCSTPTTTSCADFSPPRRRGDVLRSSRSTAPRTTSLRDGDRRDARRSASPSPAAGARRSASWRRPSPASRRSSWTAPADGQRELLPHLPRRHERYDDRYDRTSGDADDLHATATPGTEQPHATAVTAVNSSFNESNVDRARDMAAMRLARRARRDARSSCSSCMTMAIGVLGATLATFDSFMQRRCATTTRATTAPSSRATRSTSRRASCATSPSASRARSSTRVAPTTSSSRPTTRRTWVRYCLARPRRRASTERGRLWVGELAVPSAATPAPVTPAMRGALPRHRLDERRSVVADYVTNRGRASTGRCSSTRARPGTDLHGEPERPTTRSSPSPPQIARRHRRPAPAPPELAVTSGVYLRNQNQPPVASFAGDAGLGVAHGRAQRLGLERLRGAHAELLLVQARRMPAAASIDCAQPTVIGQRIAPRTLWGATGYHRRGHRAEPHLPARRRRSPAPYAHDRPRRLRSRAIASAPRASRRRHVAVQIPS